MTQQEQLEAILKKHISSGNYEDEFDALVSDITALIQEARLDELKRIMDGQKTIRSFIKGDGGEEIITTYEFANTEIQDRIKQLNSGGSNNE